MKKAISVLASASLSGAKRVLIWRLLLVSTVLLGLACLPVFIVTRPALAATCDSAGSGSWNTTGTWSCGHVPATTDDVNILTEHTVSYDGSSTILSLTTSGTGTLNFDKNVSDSLTVTGSVTNGGTIAVVNAQGTRVHTLNVGGNFTNNGTFIAISADATDTLNVVLNGGAQTISGTTTFNNLTSSAAGNKDFGSSTTTIAGALTMTSGAMLASTSTIIFTGTAGSMAGANNKNFFNLQINSGASITTTGSGNITVGGSYTNNGTLTQLSTQTFTFNGGAAQAMSGSGTTTLGSVQLSVANTVVNAGSHNFSVAGSSFDASSNTTFNGQTNTVTFAGGATTTTITTGGGTINFNSVSINSGSTLADVSKNFSVTGDWTNNGTYSKNAETVTFTGGGKTIGGSSATAFNNLTINSGGTVTLDTNTDVGASVSGVLTLTSDLTVSYPDILTQSGSSAGAGDAVGAVNRTDVGGTTKSFGNVNVQITNGGTATTVEVFLDKGSAPTGFSAAVKRTYTITAASGTVSGATLRLRYIDPDELNGNNENQLTLWRNSTGTWVNQGVTTRSTANNYDELTGISGFSSWTLAADSAAPTAVRLTGFTATTRDDGVMLEWKSGFEVNNLGYNLYRYENGQRTRVTPSIIAGSSLIRKGAGELASGFSYGWFDKQGTIGTQYELNAIDLNGDVQRFAPRYAAKNGFHSVALRDRSLLLTEVTANGLATIAEHGWAKGSINGSAKTTQVSSSSIATQQSIAAQPGVKIRVNQTGWYRVTQPQLVANGLDPAVDARKLKLFADGAEVPIKLSTNQPTLGTGDTLEFYGVGLDALTTDTHTYYLVTGARNGLRIAANPVSSKKTDTLAPDFLYTVESKERLIYLPGLLNGDNDNIFGQILSSDPVTQTVTLQNINANSTAAAQLEVIVQGFTEVDHQVQVQLNGSYVGTISFSGATHKSSTLAVNRALLREGANDVTMIATGGDADISLVDALRMTYAHTYRADNDSLAFSVGNQSAFVNGFSSPAIRVMDVTNPGAAIELLPKISNANGSYGFTIQTTGSVQNLIAFGDNLARQPAAMLANQPSTWNASTNAADLVIVTYSDFRQSAESLATARRAQGMKVSVVDVEDVYDEFSYGAHTPQSLKDFFAWSSSHWAAAPKYVLLFGDSSWDPRNYLGQGFNDFVPTKLIDTAELETASDDWLADFNDDGIPEIAVGRLPARTVADASTMVSKILTYDQERAGGTPLRGALLVADTGFEDQTTQVQSFLAPLTTAQTLSRSAIGNDDNMRTQILNAIDQGPTIVNYFGHGSVTVWTGAGLLNENNAATLTNGNRLSLFVMMTCLNGYADDAHIDSLGEIVLKNPQGGAFAVWASSGMTEPVGQAQMNTQFYQTLLGNQPATLGDAARQAKLATNDLDVRRTWILLGDPSMRVK